MREMISELGCPAEKIILNTYGPQPEFEKVSPEFKEKALIAIGRFVNKKAPYYTILAFAKSLEKHSRCSFISCRWRSLERNVREPSKTSET